MKKKIWFSHIAALILYGLIAGIIGTKLNAPEPKKEILSQPDYAQVINIIKEKKLKMSKIREAAREDYPFYLYFVGAPITLFVAVAPYWLIKTLILKILTARNKQDHA